MLIRWWEELNVVESTCNYSHPTWKQTLRVMVAKVSQIASWVLVRLLSWTQCKSWIPIGSIGCVHTHWGMLAIEGWGCPSCIWNVMQKIGENNQKFRKISRVVSQTFTLGSKHDKIQTWWASNVSLKTMLEKGYDGADVPKWNLEVEPFVTRWIIQIEEKNTHGLGDAPPNSWIDSTTSPKVKTTKGQGVRACSLGRSTSGVE